MTYQQPPGQPYYSSPPPGQPSYPQSPTAPARGRGPLLLAALAGFVVAAVICGVLVATDVIGGSSSGVGGSSDSVSLPKTIDSYVRFEDATKNQSSRAAKTVAARKKSDSQTSDALSKAHDGAGAAVQGYADQSFETLFSVWAVRAPTPAPVITVVDAAFLGLAQPQQFVKTFGDTTCLLYTTVTTPAGKTPPANSTLASLCQRSSDDLTVTFVGGGESDLAHDPDKVAALIDKVWDSLS